MDEDVFGRPRISRWWHMNPIRWNREVVQPADIIDGINLIDGKTVWTHPQTPAGWLPAETLYEWARVGLANPCELGWDIAVSYAKRAVCRRIDGLLLNNWLLHFGGRKYPDKIGMLSEIGIPIPGIVHRLVIGSRNEIEHDYRSVGSDEASNALDVAQLMLNATVQEAPREPVAMASGSISAVVLTKGSEPRSESHDIKDLGTEPLVFVDFLEPDAQVKLVYPKDHEIRFARLKQFSREEAIVFAHHMRTYRPTPIGLGLIGLPKELQPTVLRFEEFKRQTGI